MEEVGALGNLPPGAQYRTFSGNSSGPPIARVRNRHAPDLGSGFERIGGLSPFACVDISAEMKKTVIVSVVLCLGFASTVHAQHQLSATTASNSAPAGPREAELAMKSFQVAPGLRVDLWAAEPLLLNPVAFHFDEKGRAYVCETFRLGAGVDDIRGIMDWLDEDLASRTVDDRLAEMKRHLGNRFSKYTEKSERISLLTDTTGSGKADRSTVFAGNFNTPADGIAAGVLPRRGQVWYANIPNLWLLRDTNADGVADFRKSLHYGYGVRVGFLGHDLHGLAFGPDGKLYFSIGDRGANVKLADGTQVVNTESGSVFRCNPDGSELEVFSFGLRNPQDLVFDEHGNLFTGDNNSDSGDEARWVYVVEGGDNGWRVGYQFMETPYSRGPFNAEKLWYPHFKDQAAYIVPPITNIASGPSGVAYFPGTGLPEGYKGHFFLVDFRGGPANSGIHTFSLRPKGAGFELTDAAHLVWSVLATDVKFGVDGGIYFTDWIAGWGTPGKGRIYRVHDATVDQQPQTLETKRLMAEGMEKRSARELAGLLAHPDMRIRQEAQFELADRGVKSLGQLTGATRDRAHPLARLHGIWGIGQVLAKFHDPDSDQELASAVSLLRQLLGDNDAEVRAQAANVLGWNARSLGGRGRAVDAILPSLEKCLSDSAPRPRFFAALALGKLGRADALAAVEQMLIENDDRDPWLRHAGIVALAGIGNSADLVGNSKHPSRALRRASVVALRRLQQAGIAEYLKDSDPGIVLEAARAINDEPVNGAMSDLASLSLSNTSSEPLIRRVLNANFHFGTDESAKRLASFAGRNEFPEAMRLEALEELVQWEHPSGRDRVVGLWRPVGATRSAAVAADAFEPIFAGLLTDASPKVAALAIRVAAQLNLKKAASLLSGAFTQTNRAAEVRVEALRALAELDKARLDELLPSAREDRDEEVRKTASLLEVASGSAGATAHLATTLDRGSLGEKQAALLALGSLNEPAADEFIAQWLDNLKAGKVPNELELDLIEAAAKRTVPVVKEKLAAYQSSKSTDDPLAPYREALYGGHSAEGKKIFFDRPDAQCVRCHRIKGIGGDVGPDLSRIGVEKPREYILESILLPNKQIAPGFESVNVTLKNDETYAGVLKTETADQLVINSPQNGLVTIKKSDIQARAKSLSPMPEGMGQILSKRDLRNIVEYLSGLKGEGEAKK